MSILLKKGGAFTADYSSVDFPALTPDWVGSISLYTAYPGVATTTKTLVLVGNVLQLSLTAEEILDLADGVYTVVATIANAVIGVSITSVDYATVSPINISATTRCKIFGTIEKPDGTPAGSPTTTLVNTVNGTVLQAGWKGVDVKASIPSAGDDAGKIVGIETVTTQTNAAGYFELYVIKGLTVTVTCPSFGKIVVVDTTGLDTVDISTFF